MREKLLKELRKSLEDIRYAKRRHHERLEELEQEEDMTLLAIKELEAEDE